MNEIRTLAINITRILIIVGSISFCTSLIKAEGKLTELQQTKAELIKLKSQLLQCQVSTANGQLSLEKSSLESELRKQLGAKDEEVFDWNSLTFKSVPSSNKIISPNNNN